MKKFFTLIAAVAMAASVNAQGAYYVANGEVPEPNSTITSVPNITMTWGDDTWKENKLVDKKFASDAKFTYKVTGSSNASVSNMVPSSGAYVMFEATKDGVVSFAYKLNKNKTQHFVDQNGEKVIESIAETTGSSVYNLTDFPVKAGVKYYTYTEGSKMDVFGFKFALKETTGITNVNATSSANSGKTYNLAGQEVSGSYKGLVIKNGKKYVK